MSLSHTLSVHKQENVTFDDIDALNRDLVASPHFSEYFDNTPCGRFIALATEAKSGWEGSTKIGDVLFINEYDGDDIPRAYCQVWGLFDEQVAQIIGRHMTNGTLVLIEEIEGGWGPKYYKMTPGKGQLVEPSF